MMSGFLFIHIAAGSAAIVAGYAALVWAKGGPLHRKAGKVFLVAMLTMTGSAGIMSVQAGQKANVMAAVLAAYLVATAWATVRPRNRTFELVAMTVAAGLTAAGAIFGLQGAAPFGATDPAASPGFSTIFYVFGAVAALAAALDLRTLRRGGVTGFEQRVRRHLWRMCAALFIATGSFFLGQMDEIPPALHGPHLYVLALAPLGALLFWMIRTRPRRRRLRPAPAAP